MQKTEQNFSLSGDLKFAWLIRKDVRGDHDVDDIEAQKDFVLWWVLHGRKEYPKAEPLTDALKNVLFEPLDNYLSHGDIGMNRLSCSLYHLRTDVHALYDIQTLEGVIGFSQWFYIYGLKEHGFTDLLTTEIIAILNKPMTDFWHPEQNKELPKISPLIFFLWSVRKDVQVGFDINTYEGRERFLGWFFLQGLAESGLEPLLNDYWLEWVNESVVLDNAITLPRIGLLFWAFRDDIKNTFNLDSIEGQQGLAKWTREAQDTEPACQWIKTLNTQKNLQIGVNLIGFAFGELGIGEDVRMAAAACEKAGIPYTVINISPGLSVRQNDQVLADVVTTKVEQLQYPTNIFCLTGFDTIHAYLEKGRQLFANRYNIGWWPWELPVWPEQWNCAFDLIDEVWAATTYTQTMYRQATDKPVILMPLPVSIERAIPVERESLGLAENKFLFLYIFDFNSYIARKNPQAAVKAFFKAFPKKNQQVGLVLKTMNSNPDNSQWQAFQRLCQKDSRIVLIEKTLDREEVLGLINACDAYISLHRAEGFGRTPAEALLFGKPVIATDFSGNTDFINQNTGFPVKWRKRMVKVGEYPFITKQSKAYWADANIVHAAEQMQAALKLANQQSNQRNRQQFAQQQFSLSRIGQLMKVRLIEINAYVPS